MEFAPCDVCGGPLLCPSSTSARVQNRFEFVGRGGDCTGRHWEARSTRYQVPGTQYDSTAPCIYDSIGYIYEVPEHRLFATYWYHLYMNIHIFTPGTRFVCCCMCGGSCCGENYKSKKVVKQGTTYRDKEGEIDFFLQVGRMAQKKVRNIIVCLQGQN